MCIHLIQPEIIKELFVKYNGKCKDIHPKGGSQKLQLRRKKLIIINIDGFSLSCSVPPPLSLIKLKSKIHNNSC